MEEEQGVNLFQVPKCILYIHEGSGRGETTPLSRLFPTQSRRLKMGGEQGVSLFQVSKCILIYTRGFWKR